MDDQDREIEQDVEDDVTNVNGQNADDSTDELQKMTSWIHQMMSQQEQQHVVETNSRGLSEAFYSL